MTWVPDGGQIIVLAATVGLIVPVARLLFRTGRVLGRVEERLEDHDRRLDRLEGAPRTTMPEYLDSV